MERERAVSITVPYIEQKSLSIDRKIFIKYPTLPFFLGIPQWKATRELYAYTKH